MSKVIKIKKGLDIKLKGKAEKVLHKVGTAATYAVKPTDFTGITPKLLVKEGDAVKAGSALFFDKYNSDVLFTSPVSGAVKKVVRGERRKILEVVVEPNGKGEYESFKKAAPADLSREEIINNLQKSGLWPSIKMRPYSIVAKASDTPKAIFISGIDSAPLGVDYNFILQGKEKEFQAGIDALKKLTNGKIHLGIDADVEPCPAFVNVKNVEITKYTGRHPKGLVGTQIHKVDPINKGEVVWVVEPQKVVSIGRLFTEGRYDASKVVALAGSELKETGYFQIIEGANIDSFAKERLASEHVRYISGSVLSGSRIEASGHMGYYDSLLTVIPEGDHYEFFGWIAPGFDKYSVSRTFFSWLNPKKEYIVDTNLKGGKRALMITGAFEKVFPFDIFPMQLIKATIIEDIDLMEKLGIYEVVEEDFALCEFVDTSKTDIQAIVRNGLDLMIKEMS
ncbi:MAG TPA: NADH:ubiquinone reductase (Na(+)-transporting) subunit A [Bacteroidales bacterium]|jgi:Na+-transporting NADH:ubiquinone oxidoreductase subunit A|nr:NADH:ubiquinone reductase (Na(+)-transporting) subunit A [Bacteroidales bacterium]